jgi:PLP dependent protein
MISIISNFIKVKTKINNDKINIIAVSKSFNYDHIKPLVDFGHNHFGENKVQEAHSKWLNIKNKFPQINLHMIGKLQSNKAKEAVSLFDFIHSLDNIKLANLLFKFEKILNKKRKYFIQVNLGKEKQKNGVDINNLDKFYKYCVNELQLNVIGLMAIPPNDGNENLYFKLLMELKDTLGLEELSIGMSGDFKIALKYNTTFVRIGSAIFGTRT